MKENLKTDQQVVIREDGILKVGTKLVIKPEYLIKYPNIQKDREYIVSSVREVYDTELFDHITYISIEELPEVEYSAKMFSIVPTNFNVYRWKGYYILANSEEHAQRIWNTWIDNLEIVAADGRPKMYKLVNNLKNREDQELFPRAIKRLHSECSFPCIVEDLNFEKEPVFIYKFI